MGKADPEFMESRLFKAGRYWNSNVFGAALAGGLGAILMLVIACIIAWMNPTPKVILFVLAWASVLLISLMCFVPGNLIAAYPYAVSLEGGKGLELRAPLKRVYIPIGDVRDVRRSYLQPGYTVRLKRRHRLLKGFVIPWFFGDQAEPLANAIREELQRRLSDDVGQ
jgi:hypothetical protein